MADRREALRAGVVLAELGGYGDGSYCATHGQGAALVMMGTYIVDPGDSVPYDPRFVFGPDKASYRDYLQHHVAAAKGSGAAVGVSVVSVSIQHTIEFLQAAEDAGADYVSLCLHSEMAMFVSAGVSSALLREANWPRLREQLGLCAAALRCPLIAKIGAAGLPCPEEVAAQIRAAGVHVIHANVGHAAAEEGREIIRRLRSQSEFLIAGGGIGDLAQAVSALQAGADAVAVGSAAMDDPTLCGRLQRALHGKSGS